MPVGLTTRQWDMLRLVVAVGECALTVPARFHSAWVVRIRRRGGTSAVFTFAQPVGDALLRRGFIAPDPTRPERRGKSGVVVRPHVPTDAGRRVVEQHQTQKGG